MLNAYIYIYNAQCSMLNALQLNELSALRNTFYPEYKYIYIYIYIYIYKTDNRMLIPQLECIRMKVST